MIYTQEKKVNTNQQNLEYSEVIKKYNQMNFGEKIIKIN